MSRCWSLAESGVPAHTTTSSALYQHYEEWCRDNGEPVSTKTAFGKEMTRRRNVSTKSGGQKVYVGIGLVPRESLTPIL